jgi:hypothetical protein
MMLGALDEEPAVRGEVLGGCGRPMKYPWP